MNNAISAVDFFRDTLKQDVITISMHSAQSEQIGLEALDGFVVQAAAKGLLVEIWIEGERRDYQFGDYVELLKRESNRVDLNNPYLDNMPNSVKESWDNKAAQVEDKKWDDNGTPKG